MASSSRFEYCIPEIEIIRSFRSCTGNNDKNHFPIGLCPICVHPSTVFYCEVCVRNGAFMHSRGKCLERFADKKLKLYKVNERKTELLERYKTLLEKKVKAENMARDILLCAEKNRLLKESIRQSHEEIAKTEKAVKHLKSHNDCWLSAKAQYQEKLESMKKVYRSRKNAAILKKVLLHVLMGKLKYVAREQILRLAVDIFNILKIQPPKKSKHENLKESQETALVEAQQTTYVRDHWEVTQSPVREVWYRIVEANIPGNGDYSAYLRWTSRSRDVTELTAIDIQERNLSYGIGAALCFTAHFVMLLSWYLDAPFPKQLCYSEFCSSELEEQSFRHKVAKLNANIVYLCLLQNVDPSLIKPQCTIENILLLLNPSFSDLGRRGPMNPNKWLASSMEYEITKDLMLIDEEIEPGWITVCETNEIASIPMCPYNPVSEPSQQTSQKTTLTGDLLSSVATIWKAATGLK